MPWTPGIPEAVSAPRKTWWRRWYLWWNPVIPIAYCTRCGKPKQPIPNTIRTHHICVGDDQCLTLKVSPE